MADTKQEEASLTKSEDTMAAPKEPVPEPGSNPQDDVTAPQQPDNTTTPEVGESAAPTEPEKPEKIARKPVPSTLSGVDKSRPQDFEGEVLTTNQIPSPETLKKIEDYIVLDRDGKSHAFKTLYSGSNVARRVLMIFIRHFFCGNCQDYLRSLTEAISPESLLALPVSTFIVVIGCGDPALIDSYAKDTNCQFSIYTDPKRSLFDALGMKQTLALGSKPAYMKRPMSTSIFSSIAQNLRAVPSGLAHKGGNQRQVGGEFLFEPPDLVTPVSTPQEERKMTIRSPEDVANGKHEDDEAEAHTEHKRVTWCHRMKTTRDHCEIPELMDILGLDTKGHAVNNWDKLGGPMQTRKGTGSSMAAQMSELSLERERTSSVGR